MRSFLKNLNSTSITMEHTSDNDHSLNTHSEDQETGQPGNEKTVDPDQEIEITKLDADSIKVLWSKTYNTHGKPDWSHILPYYHEDILFRDTIQELRGMEAFKAMTERLTGISSRSPSMSATTPCG